MLTDPFGVNQLTQAIIGCGIRVHRALGPGLFERVYSECMAYELKEQGLGFDIGRPVPLVYKGVRLRSCFYVDLIVQGTVVVELKSAAEILEVHKRQLLTQLRLTGLPVGLLINFNVVTLTDGGRRLLNTARAPPPAGTP